MHRLDVGILIVEGTSPYDIGISLQGSIKKQFSLACVLDLGLQGKYHFEGNPLLDPSSKESVDQVNLYALGYARTGY